MADTPKTEKPKGFLFVDLNLMSPRDSDEELQKRYHALLAWLGSEGWIVSTAVQTHSDSLGGKAKEAAKK